MSSPGSPGPAPASQTWPGSSTGTPPRRAARSVQAVMASALQAPFPTSLSCGDPHLGYNRNSSRDGLRSRHERARPSAAPRLDHRDLRDRGRQGGLCGAAYRDVPRSGGGHAAARRAADFRARGDPPRRPIGDRRHRQGRRRRSRRHPWRAGPRDRAARRAGQRRHLPRRRGRRHRHASRPAVAARRTRHQPGAARR